MTLRNTEPVKKIKIAFATHDGITLHNDHFGDSSYFDIYEIDKNNSNFIGRIANQINMHEEEHADAQKAKGIVELISDQNVKVVISKIYGPNIVRIKKKFVCVLMNNKILAESIKDLQNRLPELIDEWFKGEKRNYLDLRQK